MEFVKDRFKGQNAVVTGAAQGIGAVIAERLAKEGAHVGILDQNCEKIDQTIQQIKEQDGSASGLVCDITSPEEIASRFRDFVKSQGSLEIVIHSAGIVGPTGMNMEEVSSEAFEQVCKVNLTGSFNVLKYALPHLKANNYGRVLMIASIAGKEGNAGMTCYSASKAGVIGLVKAAAKEYAKTPISINALAPATVMTPMVEAMPKHQVDYMKDKIPKGRLGKLEEVAAMSCFIVSRECSFSTGFTYDLSGGRAVY